MFSLLQAKSSCRQRLRRRHFSSCCHFSPMRKERFRYEYKSWCLVNQMVLPKKSIENAVYLTKPLQQSHKLIERRGSAQTGKAWFECSLAQKVIKESPNQNKWSSLTHTKNRGAITCRPWDETAMINCIHFSFYQISTWNVISLFVERNISLQLWLNSHFLESNMRVAKANFSSAFVPCMSDNITL